MIRRLFLFLTCVAYLLLLIPAAAEVLPDEPTAAPLSPAGRLATLDIIDQTDDRFRTMTFSYYNKMFHERGCLPASIYNALIATLGTPDADAVTLLPELLVTITDPAAPRNSMAIVERVPIALNNAPAHSARAALVADAEVRAWDSLRNAQATLREISSAQRPLLLVDKFNVSNNWTKVIDLILRLNEMGLGHAHLAFSSVSAGYGHFENAPFGSGDYGHYITLYLQVDEFCRTGTFYLLDSLPRALSGEPYGDGAVYATRYNFVRYQRMGFNVNFTPVRITPTIVQFNLTEARQAQLDALLTNTSLTSEARLAQLLTLHKQHMESVRIWGVNQIMLCIP